MISVLRASNAGNGEDSHLTSFAAWRAITHLLAWCSCLALAVGAAVIPPESRADDPALTNSRERTENFDEDPDWEGVNNRMARSLEPRQVKQNFGFSPATRHAGGRTPGEIGGLVSAAGEASYYGKVIESTDLNHPLTASGKLSVGKGGTHLLLGFFNSKTMNEWRTPNTLAFRINGRGENFFAYVEYCTSAWRAGGDTTPFPSVTDKTTGRQTLIGFPCEESLAWSIRYDPDGNSGRGVVTAMIGDATAECLLDEGHKQDGATFDRFGILNVMKSVDSGSEIWIDDLSINNDGVQDFRHDPNWDGKKNRSTFETRLVRPWFDFGFSRTNFAGGERPGELGGQIFRGDCRYPERLACYGDRLGPLSLAKPIRASGKIAMRRGVSDSTTLFGFYHSQHSMHVNDSQSNSVPESVLGIHVEGPSRDGFRFYPVIREKGMQGLVPSTAKFPIIKPDGAVHTWSFEYRPNTKPNSSTIVISLDGVAQEHEFATSDSLEQTVCDRFGIITSWIDGNSQDVFLDDLRYTVSQD